MLNINKETLIKIKTSVIRNTPKDIYLAGNLNLVKELFHNAYLIPSVKWYNLGSFFEILTGDTISEEGKKSVYKKKIDSYTENLKDLITVIPFTPSKDYIKRVTDWKVKKSNLMSKNKVLFNRHSYYTSEAREFMKILMENGNAMKIILRGVVYDSPCEFCSSIYNRISGECELFNTDEYYNQTCQPRIAFGSHIFLGDDSSQEEEVDYSKAFVQDLWNSPNSILEV